MTPQMLNYLNYTAAVHRQAVDLIQKGRPNDAIHMLTQGHVHTASGDGLDHLAEQCGVPARNGVPVPDDAVRAVILQELARHD